MKRAWAVKNDHFMTYSLVALSIQLLYESSVCLFMAGVFELSYLESQRGLECEHLQGAVS